MNASEFLKNYILENGITHITAQEVVAMAEKRDSPLHSYFQWDDARAGHRYRLWQARSLLANIKITVEDQPARQVRLMVSVPSDRRENGYQLLSHAIANSDARQELKAEIERRIAHWLEQAELLDTATCKWLEQYPEKPQPQQRKKKQRSKRAELAPLIQ